MSLAYIVACDLVALLHYPDVLHLKIIVFPVMLLQIEVVSSQTIRVAAVELSIVPPQSAIPFILPTFHYFLFPSVLTSFLGAT